MNTPIDTTPIELRWEGTVIYPAVPSEDDTIICCTTLDDGRPAALFLDDEHREALGLQLVEPDPDSDDLDTEGAFRAEVLQEVAQALEAQHCSPESVALAHRLIEERLCTDCKGYGQTVSMEPNGGTVRRCRSCNGQGLRRQLDADEAGVR